MILRGCPLIVVVLLALRIGAAVPRCAAADFPIQDRLYAKRALKPDEQAKLLRLSNQLIDKGRDEGSRTDRDWIAWELGQEYAHRYCIPALLAVLRDQSDNGDIRQRCVVALSQIPDKRVVEPIIEALIDPDYNVARQACDQLIKLTHYGIGHGRMGDPDPSSPERQAVYKQWKKWWQESSDDDELDYTHAGDSDPLFFKPAPPDE